MSTKEQASSMAEDQSPKVQEADMEEVRDATADPLTPYMQENSAYVIKEHGEISRQIDYLDKLTSDKN